MKNIKVKLEEEMKEMESVEQGKAALISGIQTDALAEEERILQEAETLAAEKRGYADIKIETMMRDAREKATEQAEKLTKKLLSGLQLELKRHSLQVQQAVIQEVLGRVENRFAGMLGEESYRAILVNWIAEGALSLDVDSAEINASEKERLFIDDGLLAEVREKIRRRRGREMRLPLSGEAALKNQGVVLTSGNGRLAYNNQVKTRILRKQRAIHALIYDALFANGKRSSNE